MHVFRFCEFGLQTPIRVPKIGGFEGFDPLNGQQYQRNPKGHILGKKDVMAHRSSKSVHRRDLCATARDEETKKDKERNKMYSRKQGIRRHRPHRRIEMKFCVVGGL